MTVQDSDNGISPRTAIELAGECANCGVLLCAPDRGLAGAYFNGILAQYLGLTREDFAAKYSSFTDVIHPDDREYVTETVDAMLGKGDAFDLIYRVVSRGRGVVWIRENGMRLGSPDRPVLYSLLSDVSGDFAARRELEQRSQSDPLTGILNRAAFTELMEGLLAEDSFTQRRHALIVLDVDHFTTVNDSFGHGYGDSVLEQVAQKLKSFVRAGDMLGRMGGDEFALCLKDIKSDAAIDNRLAQMRDMLRLSLPHDVTLSCSLGVSFCPSDGRKFADLYACACAALSRAKRSGRDQFIVYAPGMEQDAAHGAKRP